MKKAKLVFNRPIDALLYLAEHYENETDMLMTDESVSQIEISKHKQAVYDIRQAIISLTGHPHGGYGIEAGAIDQSDYRES